jgi:capsular exopolysaccharide synthesis family protein
MQALSFSRKTLLLYLKAYSKGGTQMETYKTQNTTTLRDYLKVLFRHKEVILITFIIVLGTVIIGLQFKTPVYQAGVKMLISAEKQVEATYYRDLLRSQSMEVVLTQSEIVKSNPVIERAVRATGLYDRPLNYEKKFASALKKPLIDFQANRFNKKLAVLPEEQKKAYLFRRAVDDLRREIKVEPIRDTNLFMISAREFSPIGAAIIANIVSRSYILFDLEQQLAELQLKYGEKHLSVLQMHDSIEKMKQRLNGEPLSNIEAIGPASVKIVEQAQIPLRPSGPSKFLTIGLALIMGPFLGIMLAFMFDYMDQSFKSPQDIESFLNIPFLGSIPKMKKLKKESLRKLSDRLYLLMKDKGLKSLLVTSALPREGASTITANLARHLSEKQGRKVLIIDANLRNPSLHKAFKVPENSGLAEVLEGKASFEQAVQDTGPNLDLLTAGKTKLNLVSLLGSSMMEEVMRMAKGKYELIFVDGANLKDSEDSAVVSPHLDGACLVINEGKTRRQVIKSVLGPLEQKKANIIGVILNNRRFAVPGFVYKRV